MADFTIDSLRGGLDDFTPPHARAKDACPLAENVEFFYSTLGERRLGCEVIPGLPAGITTDALLAGAVWTFKHTPSEDPQEDELWVLTRDTDDTCDMYRLNASGWHVVTFPSADDTPDMTGDYPYRIYGQSLHGKLYIAYKSNVDRLHVWDGSAIRRTGMPTPNANPTAADGLGPGAYPATTVYLRTRWAKLSGSTVLLLGEPSEAISFTPDGAHTGIVVTRVATAPAGEGMTHWRVDVSSNNVDWYDHSTAPGSGYQTAANTTFNVTVFPANFSTLALSEPLNTFNLIPSVQYLAADDDRLLLGSSFETTADGSAVRWTPVGNDPSPGGDERLNLNTDPRIDLDGLDGGSLSGLSRVVSGAFMAFKRAEGVYKILRTGQLVGSYDATCLTRIRGALPRSMVAANDQAGRPSLFWIDPTVGPMRYGNNGMEFCGYDVTNLWKRFNRAATVPCHGVFYDGKYQLHYWVALDGSDTPNGKIISHTNLLRSTDDGARGGWVTVPVGDRIADALTSVIFANDIENGDITQVPFIGKAVWAYSGTRREVVQKCDVGDVDADPVGGDPDSTYLARVRSKANLLAGILNQHECRDASILATAVTDGTVDIRIVKNFGVETVTRTADLSPSSAGEEFVIVPLDSLSLAELIALEIEIRDTDPTNPTRWRVHQFAGCMTSGQTS